MNGNQNSGGMVSVGEDLEIKAAVRQPCGGAGKWLSGSLDGYRFEAFVFAEHAEQPQWELFGDSRISKLWLRRIADKQVVFNWDRGEDIAAADARVEAAVRFLADGLADYVYAE
jgi:hypothetical protein